MAPKSLPGASQDALGTRFLLDAVSGPIFRRCSTPWDLKKQQQVLYCRQKSRFSNNSCFPAWASKKHLKIHQKWTKNRPPERSKCRSKFTCDFRCVLASILDGLGLQLGPKMAPKIAQKSFKNRFGRRKAAKTPSGGLHGPILASFGHSGASFSSF